VERLAEDPDLAPECALLENADAATVAAALMDWQCEVILVDAADMGVAPGDLRFFSDAEASMIMKSDAVSTHGLGLADGLALARALGFDRKVHVFGVQPFDLAPRAGLTKEMTERLPELLAQLRRFAVARELD
jgi:hydrogenase maturation protease